MEGKSIGFAQFAVSALGLYASWNFHALRMRAMIGYAVGSVVWAAADVVYLFFLVLSMSSSLRTTMAGFFSSNTFANLKKPMGALLDTLAADASFFTIFVAVSGAVFAVFAAYWALTFYRETLLSTSLVHLPLLAPPRRSARQPPPSMQMPMGRGALRGAPRDAPRGPGPFSGRGHRLGT